MCPHDTPALVELWNRAAAAFADRPAQGTWDGRSVTFAEVDAAAHHVADDLRGHGLDAGQPILVSLARGPVWLPVLLGLWEAGGVAIPVPRQDPDAAASLAQQTGARLWVTDAPRGPEWPVAYLVERHDPPRAAQSGAIGAAHAYAMTTSGSTGQPKLALVTHRTSAAILSGLQAIIGIAPGEHALHTAAFSFSSSVRQLFVPLLSGAQVTVLPETKPYSPVTLLAVTSAAGITSLDLTPSHLTGLVQVLETDPAAPRPAQLRRLLVASETLAPALVARWRRAVQVPHALVHLYGQTETGGAVSALKQADVVAPGSDRLPVALPFAPFKGYFEPQPNGTEELLLAGLDPADGILSDGVLDRERYETVIPHAQGLYRTGDLFVRCTDGQLFFHGRADEQIKILGIRVDVATLVREISALPGVEGVVAAAVPREAGGAVLCIGYTTRPSGGPADDVIAGEAARWIDPALPPAQAIRLTEIPLNPSGKADRSAVLEALRAALATPATSGGDPVLALWQRHTANFRPAGLAAHGDQRDFFSVGGDSLSMISLLADVARSFGIRLLPEQFHREPTLAGLRHLMQAPPTSPQPASAPQKAVSPRPWSAARPGTPRSATAGQRGLWVNEKLAGAGRSPYWLPINIDVAGALDQERLTQAFRAVLARFDALRLAFIEGADGALSLVSDALLPAHVKLQTLRGTERPDLGSMTRADRLVHLGAADESGHTRLALRIHHAVADRPSLETILQALRSAYDGPDTASGLQLAPSFLQWIDDLAARTSGRQREAASRFWAQALPPPTAVPAPRASQPRMERHRLTVPASAGSDAPRGSTRHAAWLWAFHRALATAGLEQPGLIGVDVDLRPPGMSELVGLCISTLPVILPETKPGAEGERATGAAIARMLPHADVPIAEVVPPARRPTGDPRQPFFLYHLVYQRSAYPAMRLGGFEARYTRLPAGIAEHNITLFVRESSDRVDLELAWNAQVLNPESAHGMLAATATRFGASKDGRI